MFLLDFFRYLRGYVRFTAQGMPVERFLNLAARDRISIWDGKKRGDIYTGSVAARDYARLRRHARKAGVRIRLSEKRGVPFTRYRYRRRQGLLIGVLLFGAFLFVMSLFIWRIEVHGNEKVPESRIIEVLREQGIRPGTLRSSIDVRESEGKTLLIISDLSWVALNIKGSTLYAEVSERILPPPMVDPHKPCNVVAKMPGVIMSLEVYDGQAMVKSGDAVLAGDILISGITLDRQGQSLFRHARGKVLAMGSYVATAEVPLNQVEYAKTGAIRSRTYLDVIGFQLPLSIPFGIPPPYCVDRVRTEIAFFSLPTPVSVLEEKYTLMREIPILLTAQQAMDQALIQIAAVENTQLAGARVHDRALSSGVHDGVFWLRADYICTLDIAMEKEILLGTPQ